MVIEYAGTVIRSVLTDKREKYYDSKVCEYITLLYLNKDCNDGQFMSFKCFFCLFFNTELLTDLFFSPDK